MSDYPTFLLKGEEIGARLLDANLILVAPECFNIARLGCFNCGASG
jgi:hypothetical protein